MTDQPTAERFVQQLEALCVPGGSSTKPTAFRCDDELDEFLPVRMRDVFALAKANIEMSPDQIEVLLDSRVHQVRVGAVSVMDWQARRAATPPQRRRELYELYLRRHDRINNWDLVDRAAPSVVGGYLADRSRQPLYRLARTGDAWQRRTAIVSTWHFIRRGELDDTFAVAQLLVRDPHDLVQMAVGGWLCEAGKRDIPRLRGFLDTHAAVMPRIMLRYAARHLDADERRHYRQVSFPDQPPPTDLSRPSFPDKETP